MMMSNWAIWLLEGNGKKENIADMLAMLHSISYSGKMKYLTVTFQSQNNCTELKSSYFGSY